MTALRKKLFSRCHFNFLLCILYTFLTLPLRFSLEPLSGDMYGYLVGTQDRWEYLVAGDPLRQIGEAEPEAKQGEV